MKAYAVVSAVAAVAAVALAGGWAAVSRSHASWDDAVLKASDVTGPWPLTVPEIKVECGDELAIYGHVGDKVFPLNGQAERQAIFYKHGPVTRLEDIQKDDPWTNAFIPGAKMAMDPVSQAVIQHCEKAGRWVKT
jgi:hypothetical protein